MFYIRGDELSGERSSEGTASGENTLVRISQALPHKAPPAPPILFRYVIPRSKLPTGPLAIDCYLEHQHQQHHRAPVSLLPAACYPLKTSSVSTPSLSFAANIQTASTTKLSSSAISLDYCLPLPRFTSAAALHHVTYAISPLSITRGTVCIEYGVKEEGPT
jgi:hypothetical protein